MTPLPEILHKIASGYIPAGITEECECHEEVLELINYLDELKRFVGAISTGDLNATIHLTGPLAGSLKALHANLRHLTWQTQQVAAGDFNQRVDFMGAFSNAFNSMVEALSTARKDLTERNQQLSETCEQLKSTQSKLLQQEKMASIGQLAAGVAHEINNPMGFITSNLGTLGKYSERFKSYFTVLDEILASSAIPADVCTRLKDERKKLKIDLVLEDIPNLLAESADGAERVKKIVLDLKGFSRVDAAEFETVDLNQCLESTINIVWNELKQKAELNREFLAVTKVTCRPQQLNQVFMNLLLNAVQAIENNGNITVRTYDRENGVCVEVTDNGCGIAPEHLNRIFDPFFTTKPVGKGIGLGLSISYDIIKKQGGDIMVASTPGRGTTFRVLVPLEPIVEQ